MSIGVSRLLGLAFLWPLNDMSLAISTVISVFTFIDVHNCESSVICAHPLLHGVGIGNVALGMLLQMTMITGMEADTRPSSRGYYGDGKGNYHSGGAAAAAAAGGGAAASAASSG